MGQRRARTRRMASSARVRTKIPSRFENSMFEGPCLGPRSMPRLQRGRRHQPDAQTNVDPVDPLGPLKQITSLLKRSSECEPSVGHTWAPELGRGYANIRIAY